MAGPYQPKLLNFPTNINVHSKVNGLSFSLHGYNILLLKLMQLIVYLDILVKDPSLLMDFEIERK